jgi:hypothetical protein
LRWASCNERKVETWPHSPTAGRCMQRVHAGEPCLIFSFGLLRPRPPPPAPLIVHAPLPERKRRSQHAAPEDIVQASTLSPQPRVQIRSQFAHGTPPHVVQLYFSSKDPALPIPAVSAVPQQNEMFSTRTKRWAPGVGSWLGACCGRSGAREASCTQTPAHAAQASLGNPSQAVQRERHVRAANARRSGPACPHLRA